MGNQNRGFMSLFLIIVLLFMVMFIAQALDVMILQSAEFVDGIYMWKGSFDPESLQPQNSPVQNVCVVFDPEIDAVACTLTEDPEDEMRLLYTCSVAASDFATATNWQVVATPSDSCTGIGAQELLDEGLINPTAVSLTDLAARSGGDGKLSTMMVLTLGIIALSMLVIFATLLRRKVV